MGLYENVKELCKENSTSVMALEDRLGFARSSICKWDTNIPSVEKVRMVADEFGVSVDRLVKDVTFSDEKRKEEG